MVSLVSPLFWQMQYLIQNLSKKNFKSNVAELNQLVDLYGQDARIFLLGCLIEEIDFRDSKTQKDALRIQLLSHEMSQASLLPNFTSIMAQVMHKSTVVTEDFLAQFCKVAKLGIPQQTMMGLALASNPTPSAAAGLKFLLAKIPQLQQHTLSVDMLHALVSFLKESLHPDQSRAPLTSLERIQSAVVLDGLSHAATVDCSEVLTTQLLVQELTAGNRLDQCMQELGYDCTLSSHTFSMLFEEAGIQILTDQQLADILTMMTRTYHSLRCAPKGSLVGNLSRYSESGSTSTASTSSTWNIDVVASVIRPLTLGVDWHRVVTLLDSPDFLLHKSVDFRYLVTIFCAVSTLDFCLEPLLTHTWTNITSQMHLLYAAITATSDVVNFGVLANVLKPFDGAESAGIPGNQCWISIDLIERLLELSANAAVQSQTLETLDKAKHACPDLLIAVLAHIPERCTIEYKSQLFVDIFQSYIHARPNAPAMLRYLWSVNAPLVMFAVVHVLSKASAQASTLLRVFALLRNTGDAYPRMLHSRYFLVAIALAVTGANHDATDLSSWLLERIASEKLHFAYATMLYIRNNYAKAIPKVNLNPDNSTSLSLESLAVLLKCLKDSCALLAGKLDVEFQKLSKLCLQAHPILSTSAQVVVEDHVAVSPEVVAPVVAHKAITPTTPQKQTPVTTTATLTAEEVEEKANSYFQRIYTLDENDKNAAQVIEMLKKFKNSDSETEKAIFVCMIHNLFDEYRFFHKYPEKELRVTGKLFGNLIQHELVTNSTLSLALRYVHDALIKPVDSKLFQFGVFALNQFTKRLPSLPNYCVSVSQIAALRSKHPEIMSHVDLVLDVKPDKEAGDQQKAAAAATLAVSVAPSVVKISVDHIFGPLSLASTSEPPVPSESVQDRLHFIINNVSISNLESKLCEMRDFLEVRHFDWLSSYLVTQRISTQPNYHTVYLIMIEKLGFDELEMHVKRKALQNVRRLLTSRTITTNSQERTLLKNLGSWLGMFTLARNRPLLTRDIDIKELLYVGYETGHLIAVTSFIAKILDGCKKTKIFKPPNPWIMGLVRVMREIYDVPDLKLNIKFEIEVLCKALNLKLNDVAVESELEDRKNPPKSSINPDFNSKNTDKRIVGSPASTPVTTPVLAPSSSTAADLIVPADLSTLSPSEASLGDNAPSDFPANFQETTVIPNLAAYVSINPQLVLFQTQPTLKRAIPVAVDRAIREIIQPVVERSVTIACITTREMVNKDFAIEGDEEKMRKCAHLMVSNLAGSLALVTCKEPLRVSIGNHIRSLLSCATVDAAQLEKVTQVCSAENLELGCMLIEKAATEKAMRDIDESLSTAYTARRRHKELTNGNAATFEDKQVLAHFPPKVPAPFRPQAGGLKPQQLLVYEAYQRLQRQPVVPPARSSYSGSTSTPSATSLSKQPATKTTEDIVAQFDANILKVLEKLVRQTNGSFLQLNAIHNPDHELFVKLRDCKSVLSTNSNPELCKAIAHFMFTRLYELGNERGDELLLDVLCVVLETLVELYPSLRKDLALWLVRAQFPDDKLKLHCEIILSLLRRKLVQLADLDIYLCHNMEQNFTALEFALHIIRPCLTSMPHISVATDLKKTVEALERIIQRHGPQNQNQVAGIISIVDRIRSNERIRSSDATHAMAANANLKPEDFRHTISKALEHWIAHKQPMNEKALLQYLSMLKQFGLLKDEETMAMFLKIATELCVDACLKVSGSGSGSTTSSPLASPTTTAAAPPLTYTVIDAYTKLVVVLVKHADPNANVKLNILGKAMAAIHSLLIRTYELSTNGGSNNTKFDQRVFFRLYVGLMHELTMHDPSLEAIHLQILSTFATAFNTLQPLNVAGFAFAWMNCISHRTFLPALLNVPQKHGWQIVYRLIVNMILFMEPYLRQVVLTPGMMKLYKGLVKLFLVLLHDFSEFLCEFHLSFCNLLPPTCVQLRNLILSAFPRNMRLPDPLTQGLQLERLNECKQVPLLAHNWMASLTSIKDGVSQYLKTRQPSSYCETLAAQLMSSDTSGTGKTASNYNVATINALVLFIGSNVISQQNGAPYDFFKSRPVELVMYQQILHELDAEGRYLVLSAMANHLRYPNAHTYFFSSAFLYLFSASSEEQIKEQITRVILERLIAHRPHPWGLLVTFIELIRNKSYQFWDQRFLECSNEIKMVFDDVARSCMGGAQSEDK